MIYDRTVCSVTNLLLIWDMQNINSSTFLIFCMSSFQLICDVSSYFNLVSSPTYPTLKEFLASTVLRASGALSSIIISNFMMYSVLSLIRYKRVFNALRNGRLVLLTSCIPSAIFAILFLVGYLHNMTVAFAAEYLYIAFLFASILFNIVAYVYMEYSLRQSNFSAVQRALFATCFKRLKYYPLIQIFAQFGFTFFEFHYGWDFNTLSTTNTQHAAHYGIAFTNPFFSIGYLIIFLLIHPNAHKYLKSRVFKRKRYIMTPFEVDNSSRLRKYLSDHYVSNPESSGNEYGGRNVFSDDFGTRPVLSSSEGKHVSVSIGSATSEIRDLCERNSAMEMIECVDDDDLFEIVETLVNRLSMPNRPSRTDSEGFSLSPMYSPTASPIGSPISNPVMNPAL